MRALALPLLLAACQPGPEPPADPVSSDDTEDTTGSALHGRLETIDGRDVLHLWGTRYEMGYAEGALLCGRLTEVFEDYILNYLVAEVGYDWDTISTLALGLIDLPQGDRAEIEGIAAGMREHCEEADLIVTSDHLGLGVGGSRPVELDDLLVANAVGDWACSSFTAWGEATATGATIHARNFDYSVDPGGTFLDQHIVKVYTSSEEGDARFVSVSTPGLVGCISCFTEEGTAFTMHNIVGLESSSGYDFVPRMLAMRQALVATVGAPDPAAAADVVLEATPQHRGNGLHLGWAETALHGPGGAVFEYDGNEEHPDGRTTVRTPGEHQGSLQTQDATICTNHYQQRTAPPSGGDSMGRNDTLAAGLDQAVASGGLDADGARVLLESVARDWTAHATILDASDRSLRIWVAERQGQPALEATPITLMLDELWD